MGVYSATATTGTLRLKPLSVFPRSLVASNPDSLKPCPVNRHRGGQTLREPPDTSSVRDFTHPPERTPAMDNMKSHNMHKAHVKKEPPHNMMVVGERGVY